MTDIREWQASKQARLDANVLGSFCLSYLYNREVLFLHTPFCTIVPEPNH